MAKVLTGAKARATDAGLSPAAEATPTTAPMRPVRVLYVRDHIVWGGGTLYFVETLPKLDSRRLVATFCVLKGRSEVADAFEARGIEPIFVDRPGHDPRRLKELLRVIDAHGPDLVHLSGPTAMLFGRIAARLRGVPAIVHFNNALPEPLWRLWAQRRLARWTAAGVAVSKATQAWAVEQYGLPAESVEVLYSGHDLAPFAAYTPTERRAAGARVRTELGVRLDAQVIGLPGRVVAAQKGQIGMIEALPAIKKVRPDAHLMIVGGGPDLAACRRRAAELGLAASVTFTGERRDMPELMTAMDLVVVPSLVEEAFGFVALEGSAVGLPVVAFRSGGLPEVVVDGETGLIAAKGNWQALVDCCIRFLSQPEQAAAFGERGRARALGFTVDAHVEELTRFHERLAARHAPRLRDAATPATAETPGRAS